VLGWAVEILGRRRFLYLVPGVFSKIPWKQVIENQLRLLAFIDAFRDIC
jgi:hypothetical protein